MQLLNSDVLVWCWVCFPWIHVRNWVNSALIEISVYWKYISLLALGSLKYGWVWTRRVILCIWWYLISDPSAIRCHWAGSWQAMTLTRCVRPPDRGSDDHDNAAVSDDTDTYARTHPQSSMGCWALHGLYIRMYLLVTFYRRCRFWFTIQCR